MPTMIGSLTLAGCSSVAAIFFDLSKPFDFVPHGKLIFSLSTLGISGPLLKRFSNYLTERHQKVVLDGHSSSLRPIPSGVPQGSYFSPPPVFHLHEPTY